MNVEHAQLIFWLIKKDKSLSLLVIVEMIANQNHYASIATLK
jgi:hypothetical protein